MTEESERLDTINLLNAHFLQTGQISEPLEDFCFIAENLDEAFKLNLLYGISAMRVGSAE